jgi:hypothetical protein
MGSEEAMAWSREFAGERAGTIADPAVWERTARLMKARRAGLRARLAHRVAGRLRLVRLDGHAPPPFMAESQDYRRGVEFGILWAQVKAEGSVASHVHADMAEMVIRLAESRDLPFAAVPGEGTCPCGRCEAGAEWLEVLIG